MQIISILVILGLTNAKNSTNKIPTSRIVGGNEVHPKFQYPWIVSLQYEGYHSCGGTLYNKKTVITAAHCVDGSVSDWTASIHRHDLSQSSQSESGKTYDVLDQINHPNYNENDDNGYDVSIWKIKASGISTSAINLDNGIYDKKEGALLIVIGWGTTLSDGDTSDVLLEVQVPVFSISKCKRAYPDLHISSQFCAGYPEGGKDSCQGDSGGPIFIKRKGSATLVGVVSWGNECALSGYPGVYTRVSAVSDFIEENSY